MCIFCKIASGEIPCYKIYEDEDFLAFLDLSQATIGHTLVISKKHYSNIFELNEDTKIMEVVIKVAKALKESLEIENINILNNIIIKIIDIKNSPSKLLLYHVCQNSKYILIILFTK